jgi:predicted nucleotidyltransferase
MMMESLYIAKSKIRQDLLALFFTNPSKKYYLREIQRILGYSAGSIRRELLKFQGDNLFNTQREGNLLYYALNVEHPLFKELKAIVAKTVGIEGSFRNALSSVEGIKVAFIYGSFAAKREKGTSDIDLMIIGNPDTSQLNEKIATLEKKLGREINSTIYALAEYIGKKKAKSGFIMDLLKNPKIMVIGREDDL